MASSSAPSSPRRQTPRLQQLQSRPPLLSSRSIPSSPTSATASPSSYSAALVSPRRTPSMAPTSFAAPSPPPSSTASTTSSRVTASSHATPTPTPPTSGATAAGTLRVEVISARNLHAAVLGSLLKWTANTSNPYVVVTLHREEYITTTKDQTLNPTWKETGHLQVPLPSEQELLQTVGVHRTVLDTGGAHSFGDATGKLSGGKSLHGKTASGGGSGGSGSEFHACFPHLHVQVFHQTDQLDVAAHASGSPRTARRGLDKLIGEVLVPVLPCLMSSTSSHRAWYTLLSDEHPDAGQIQLALHYDVGGIEPLKHDIVRLAGFGGMEYYAKLVNANARLEVIDVFQDEVLVQYKSQENWLLSFEVHRNLLCVVRRPSMLRDAQSQLQGQIIRVRHSPLVARAHRVWQIVPATPRRQLHHLYELAVFSGGAAYTVVSKSVDTTLQQGVQAGVKSCVHGSTEAVSQVSLEALRLFWSGEDSRPKPKRPSPTEEMAWFLEGGPLSGRGKVVHAFGGDTAGAGTYHGHLDEEEKVEESGFVFTVDPEDDEDESLNARESLRNEDEEKSNEEEAAKGDLWGDDVPEQLICPITGCPMLDPVVAADGHTYEREAILQWFAGSNKSPMTGANGDDASVSQLYAQAHVGGAPGEAKGRAAPTVRRREPERIHMGRLATSSLSGCLRVASKLYVLTKRRNKSCSNTIEKKTTVSCLEGVLTSTPFPSVARSRGSF